MLQECYELPMAEVPREDQNAAPLRGRGLQVLDSLVGGQLLRRLPREAGEIGGVGADHPDVGEGSPGDARPAPVVERRTERAAEVLERRAPARGRQDVERASQAPTYRLSRAAGEEGQAGEGGAAEHVDREIARRAPAPSHGRAAPPLSASRRSSTKASRSWPSGKTTRCTRA